MSRSRILVVCTANICRSPMAERLLAEYFVRQAPDLDVVVTSAGTRARPDHAAADGMQKIAGEWGLDLGYHKSRRIDADMAQRQDLIITMEDRHRSVVSKLGAGLGQRTFTITELDALLDSDAIPAPDTDAGLEQHVARWHAVRARHAFDAPDVDDPYGRADEEYVRVAWRLAALVERLGPALADAERRS